jgi:hypothetical protein
MVTLPFLGKIRTGIEEPKYTDAILAQKLRNDQKKKTTGKFMNRWNIRSLASPFVHLKSSSRPIPGIPMKDEDIGYEQGDFPPITAFPFGFITVKPV